MAELPTFARDVLIHLPGLGTDTQSSINPLASSIAKAVDLQLDGEVRLRIDDVVPAPIGLHCVARLWRVVPDRGVSFVDVFEASYTDRLEELKDDDAGPAGTPPRHIFSSNFQPRVDTSDGDRTGSRGLRIDFHQLGPKQELTSSGNRQGRPASEAQKVLEGASTVQPVSRRWRLDIRS